MLDVMLVTPTVLVSGDRLGEMEERRLSAMMLRFKDFADKCGGGDNHFSLGVDADSEQAGGFSNGPSERDGVLQWGVTVLEAYLCFCIYNWFGATSPSLS